jgi:type IV pilus assembly protein PilV
MLGKSRRNQSGFTLLEVMIAMVIMGVGLLTIAIAQLASLRMATESKQMSQATYLAEQQLETFYLNVPTVSGVFQDPNNPIEVLAGDDDVSTFVRSWTVTADQPRAGMSTIAVQVAWNSAPANVAAGRQTVTLQGIVGP